MRPKPVKKIKTKLKRKVFKNLITLGWEETGIPTVVRRVGVPGPQLKGEKGKRAE